jgi:hypothetical protein
VENTKNVQTGNSLKLRKKSKQSTQVPFLTPKQFGVKEKKKDCLIGQQMSWFSNTNTNN